MSEADIAGMILIYAIPASLWAVLWWAHASRISQVVMSRGHVYAEARRVRISRMRMAWLAPVWFIPAAFLVGRALWRNFREAWLTKEEA